MTQYHRRGLVELPWIPVALDDPTLLAPGDSQRIAEECYTRYTFGDGCDHDVKLNEWADLPPETRARWCAALAPTARMLAEHERLHEHDRRASARLDRLERAVAEAALALPDMLALGSQARPLVALLRNLSTALAEARRADAPGEADGVAA